MNLKNCLLITCLSLLALLLTSCQMLTNRKPQSAGFKRYCPTCLMKNVVDDVKGLQKVVQVSNKQSTNPYTSVNANDKCPKGYVEGVKYHDKTYSISSDDNLYFNRMKCISKDMLLYHKYEYYVHTKGKCTEGYVPGKWSIGIIYRGQHRDSFISCTHKNKLPPVYEVDVYGECPKGYVEGRKLINNDGHYNSMKCIHKEALPGDTYAVHTKGKCAEDKGYVEGRKHGKWWIPGRSYGYMSCIHKSKLGDKYDVHAGGECAEGYTVMATNNPSTDNKRCVLSHTIEK